MCVPEFINYTRSVSPQHLDKLMTALVLKNKNYNPNGSERIAAAARRQVENVPGIGKQGPEPKHSNEFGLKRLVIQEKKT